MKANEESKEALPTAVSRHARRQGYLQSKVQIYCDGARVGTGRQEQCSREKQAAGAD